MKCKRDGNIYKFGLKGEIYQLCARHYDEILKIFEKKINAWLIDELF